MLPRNENELKAVTEKRDRVRAEIEEINNTISENMDKVREMQEKVYSMQSELIKIQTEKSGKLDLVNQFNARAREIKEKISALELRQSSIQENIDNLQEEIDAQEAELHSKEKQVSDVEKNISDFEENIKTAATQITQNEETVSSNKQKIVSLNESRVVLQKELTEITEDIVTMLDSRLKDAGFSESAMQKAKENLDSTVGKLKVFAEGRRCCICSRQWTILQCCRLCQQEFLFPFQTRLEGLPGRQCPNKNGRIQTRTFLSVHQAGKGLRR